MPQNFIDELEILLRAPYAYIYIVTHDEPRAVSAVADLASKEGRPLKQWSGTGGLGGEDRVGEISVLLDHFERETEPVVYVVKDPHPLLGDPVIVRRFREIENAAAAFGKSLVMISPVEVHVPELSTDITTLHMPLPTRTELTELSLVVFPAEGSEHLDREGLVAGALGLTTRQALRAFHRVRFEWQRAHDAGQTFDPASAILAEKRRIASTSEVIEFVEADRSMADVGGLTQLKQWLAARREAFGERARSFGLPVPRGLLLLGVQGCGKSLMAKVVANHFGLPLLRLEISALFAGEQSPDAAFRSATRTAEALKPAVLWVDEIDKVFDASSTGGDAHRLLGTLLTWLQEKTSPIFFVATANRVTHLPPELLRKGRFDEVFFVDLPDRAAREQILGIHVSRNGRNPDAYDLRALSEKTANFSGAELEQVVAAALYLSFAASRDLVQQDLDHAIASTVSLYRTYEEEIKATREWARTRTRFATSDSSVLDYFSGQ